VNLTRYKRLVGLDADLLVLKNIDEVMEIELMPQGIACVPDCTCSVFSFLCLVFYIFAGNPYQHKELEDDW
jgi:alpha-N-acetylglucosamine transferase